MSQSYHLSIIYNVMMLVYMLLIDHSISNFLVQEQSL